MTSKLILGSIYMAVCLQYTMAIQCYNQTNIDVVIPGFDVGTFSANTKSSACMSRKWCSRVTVDSGIIVEIPGIGKQIPVNGTVWKCLESDEANAGCDRYGIGCHKVEKFSQFNGDLELCCCDSDMCNNDISIDKMKAESQRAAQNTAAAHPLGGRAAGALLAALLTVAMAAAMRW